MLLRGEETSAVEGTATEERLRFLLPEVDPLVAPEAVLARAAEAGESLFVDGDALSAEPAAEPRSPAEVADESLGAADRGARRDGALVVPEGD